MAWLFCCSFSESAANDDLSKSESATPKPPESLLVVRPILHLFFSFLSEKLEKLPHTLLIFLHPQQTPQPSRNFPHFHRKKKTPNLPT
nr:hypothetical protein Iba_chr06eCG8060 [Ipomoea batatas]